MTVSTSGVLSTAADLSAVVYETFHLRITARDHGEPPRSSHVDVVVVVDASIAYTDRQRAGQKDLVEDTADDFIDANLPFLIALLGFCAAFVIIVIVLIAVAAAACGSRRRSRSARQVTITLFLTVVKIKVVHSS